MFIELVKNINNFNSLILGWSDKYIEMLPIADFLKDAIIDSVNLVPFLFVIFFLIELVELYFSHNLRHVPQEAKLAGPFLGALTALVPQCGFSVIASTLYIKNLITCGTLIAVYISTSDEAIPVLLAHPEMLPSILPILGVKFLLAIVTGYSVDFICKPFKQEPIENSYVEIEEHGCCHHEISNDRFKKRTLILHPLKHTLSIFAFILAVSIVLNWILMLSEGHLQQVFLYNSPLQPILSAIVGLIPNCAVSVLITMLYVEHAISFGSVIAGLSTGAGLGLIILLKKNSSAKDTAKIILILLCVSMFAGMVLQWLHP